MEVAGVYRTAKGKIWRVIESQDGGVRVETLEGEEWVPGRIGMLGLRLSAATKRLSPKAIRDLPA